MKELGIPRANQHKFEVNNTRKVGILPTVHKLKAYKAPIEGNLPGCSYKLNKLNTKEVTVRDKYTERKKSEIVTEIIEANGDLVEKKFDKVVNISKKTIPTRIITILKLGLNFAFTNENVNKGDLMVELINGSKNLDINKQMEFCLETTDIIINHKVSRRGDSRIKELSDFCEKENILIKKVIRVEPRSLWTRRIMKEN